MATGEKTFSTRGQQVSKPDFKPFPAGEYELKLLGDTWEQRVADGTGKLPYLNGRVEVLGTAKEDGGKNRQVFHRFFLDLTPTKNGTPMTNMGAGIVAFAKAIPEEMSGITVLTKPKGEEGVPADILSPKSVLAWLKAHDGVVVKAYIKIEKSTDYGDRNVIGYFVEGEGSIDDGDEVDEDEVDETDDESELDEESDEETDESDEDEGEEDEDEDESPVPPPKKKKPAGKPVAKKKGKR